MREVLQEDGKCLVVADEAQVDLVGGRECVVERFDERACDFGGASLQERANGVLLPLICDREDDEANAVSHGAACASGDVPELRKAQRLTAALPGAQGLVECLDDD